MSGEAMAVAISFCSRPSTAAGVPLGAHRPVQLTTPAQGTPASANVGTSGKEARRLSPLTASRRSLPPRTLGIRPLVDAICMSMVPESTACVASAAPLKGMCMKFTPAAMPRASLAKCGVVPAPPEP